MRAFSMFVKRVATIIDWQRLPATPQMTLHDALRLCAGQVHEGGDFECCDVYRYSSEADLLNQWQRLDNATRLTGNRTVIFVLAKFLHRNLRDVLQRRRLADRLVIVPHTGHWPGIDSYGDLVISARSLGWKSIELFRDLRDVPGTGKVACSEDQQTILVLPPSILPSDLRRLLGQYFHQRMRHRAGG